MVGVWCRELQCQACGCSFFEQVSRGRYPRACHACRAEPPERPRGADVLDPDLALVRERALSVRPAVDRVQLVKAVGRAGHAKGIPAQREALLDLSATALALATRTPGHRFGGREAA